MPRIEGINKVMVIGSGPIVIGQAAEFDYAGTQACRVLKREGINVVLVNSNPATIMTDAALADEIYLEPLTQDTIRRVIEKERPDGLLAGFGGQNGLTLAMQLDKEGYFEKMGVRLLGTGADAIDRAEDRKLFKEAMDALGQPTIPSDIAGDVETALRIAGEIGYPVIVRPAFTLGGAGGGVGYTEEELREVAAAGLQASPISQVLIEKYIYGWKEIEFEVVRDSAGNAVAVCSMENVDPVGVHTGDSIVVAPTMTLANPEYQMLRSAALAIVEGLGVVGGCNCQFALDPNSFQYAVIEVNPRLSRSSALASKATGYPIAKVAAEIALGYTLDEIKNEVTGKTFACFEPAVDYVVVKFPRWPFDKFQSVSRKLGTQMKATGEVMAIADSFEAAMMKAVRGAEIKRDTLGIPGDPVEGMKKCDDLRIFYVFSALKQGVSVDEIHEITRIDRFFLHKLRRLAEFERELESQPLTPERYARAKKLGYPNSAISRLTGERSLPENHAVYRMVDTCAGEYGAETPYFYQAASGVCESRAFPKSGKDRIIVLGSGPIRIGQGIEFDYSSVHCVRELRNMGYEVVIINNNPETVSTDYDTADRLYFEPLTEEDVMNVICAENPVGVVVAFGGQTAIKLTESLVKNGIQILGTSAEGIDLAEDRARFDALLEELGIRRPAGRGALTLAEALSAAEEIGYPVLLRPSYVIGGQNMRIAHGEKDVRNYMNVILAGGVDNPVLIDKYMQGIELETDVISDGEDVLIPGIMEHIERAGVHSGDSIAVYPPYNLTDDMTLRIVECSEKLALALGTKGLVNIQYLIWHGELFVIEVNPRASRTIPYISKVTGVPMVSLASRVMLGEKLRDLGCGTGLAPQPPYYAVKVPVFSFEKLSGANAALGPEMKSTGEVLGVGRTLPEALFKGLTSAGIETGRQTGDIGVMISVDEHEHHELVALAKKLSDRGVTIYATPGTAKTIRSLGVSCVEIGNIWETDEAYRLIEEDKLSYVVYTDAVYDSTTEHYAELNRRALTRGIACFTSTDTALAMADLIASHWNGRNTELVDICHLRRERQKLAFAKMQDLGSDCIFVDNRDGGITCPESLAITLCDRHSGIGGDALILIESSDAADARMRTYNLDGSRETMAGNAIRCVGKYMRDRGLTDKNDITVETDSGVRALRLYTVNGKVRTVRVDMGRAVVERQHMTVSLPDGEDDCVSVNVGNPNCVIFRKRIMGINMPECGRVFEEMPEYPDGVNACFTRVVDENTLSVRCWERGNGETMACGTGACAAAVAAVERGYCLPDTDITVKLKGGDLVIRVEGDRVILTGGASHVFDGTTEY